MKLTVNKGKGEEQLIKLSCRTTLSRINNNTSDVMYLIQQLCSTYKLAYTEQLGSVCAHITKHYANNPLNASNHLVVAHRMVNRFSLIFLNVQSQEHKQICDNFGTFEELVAYGVKCVMFRVPEQFREIFSGNQFLSDKLRGIIVKLLRSLLLQFIPVELSRIIMGIYLQQGGNEIEQKWIKQNKQKFSDLYPYQDVFQLVLAMSYNLSQSKNTVNIEHFLQSLERPLMGVIEWPMIIGYRDHFELPTLE